MSKYDNLLLATVKLCGCVALLSGGVGVIKRWWMEGFAMEDMMFVAMTYGIFVIVEHLRGK